MGLFMILREVTYVPGPHDICYQIIALNNYSSFNTYYGNGNGTINHCHGKRLKRNSIYFAFAYICDEFDT